MLIRINNNGSLVRPVEQITTIKLASVGPQGPTGSAGPAGTTIAGYGAPAKGNTLLNYCGITSKLLSFTVDISPHKQNRFLPGSHIPIFKPEKIFQDQPDYLLILPWNIKDEIMIQMKDIRKWGGKFVTFIPKITVE